MTTGAVSSTGTTVKHFVASLATQVASAFSPGQLKIVMGNLQINASLTVVFDIPWPPIHAQFLEMLNIFKLDLFKGLTFAVPCLHSSHFMSLASFVVTPLVLVAVFAAAFGCVAIALAVKDRAPLKCRRSFKKLPCGRATVASAFGNAVKLMLNVILFIYPTICSKVFMTFKCVDVGESGQFMVADMSVACYEGEWLVWAAVAGTAMLFYVVGIPVACVVLLWIAQKRGALQFPTIEISDETQLIPSMIVESVRRTNEYLLINAALSSLYVQYEKMFWWFESCCTMRKMILTGALVLFSAGTTPQVATALTVCVFWVIIIANLKPFGENVDNLLAQVEGMQVLFTLLIGLILQLEAKTGDETDKKYLGIVLIAFNCIVVALAAIQQPIVLTVASRVTGVCRRCRQRMRARQEWDAVWIVLPTDREFENSRKLERSGGNALDELATEAWCDIASQPPRVMKSMPIALTHDQTKMVRGKHEVQSWFFDTEGCVVRRPEELLTVEAGIRRWIDLDTMRVLEAPPTQLFEAHTFSDATYFLDSAVQALLRSKPRLLVLAETEGARPAWRHRVRKTLTEANPGLPTGALVVENDASDFSGFAFANPTALEKARAGQTVEMTSIRMNEPAAAPDDAEPRLNPLRTSGREARARRIEARGSARKGASTNEPAAASDAAEPRLNPLRKSGRAARARKVKARKPAVAAAEPRLNPLRKSGRAARARKVKARKPAVARSELDDANRSSEEDEEEDMLERREKRRLANIATEKVRAKVYYSNYLSM